jgi:hypothetical protein
MRRFSVSAVASRAYVPPREEDECGMTESAGRDNAGHDSSERNAAGQEKPGFGGAGAPAGAAPVLPDPQKLAQDWITLWQSELSAMAADPEMRDSWQTLMAVWAGTMSAMLRGLPRPPSYGERHGDPYAEQRGDPATDRYDRTGGQPGTADAPRATPADATSDARDAEIERLARHVATLERRLADLEHGGDPPVPPKRRPGRKARK